MQNWGQSLQYQRYFDNVVLITEVFNEQNQQLSDVLLSFYECESMKFTIDFEFTNSQLQCEQTLQYVSFRDLMKQLDELFIQHFISKQKTFIFCYYGKNLFLRNIPQLAMDNGFKPQSYYLQFIDLRQELYEYTNQNYSDILPQLNSDFNSLLPIMSAKLQIIKQSDDAFQNRHYTCKQILSTLKETNHIFGNPVIISPQHIYGSNLYKNQPWFDTIPDTKPKQLYYFRIRGIPYSYGKKELIQYFSQVKLNDNDVGMNHNQNGQFNGDAYLQIKSKQDSEYIRESNRKSIENRYIEVFNSDYDEFRAALDSENQTGSNKDAGRSESPSGIGVLKLRGLPWSCTERDVREFLGKHESIKDITFVFESNGKSKGECFVVFKQGADVQKLQQKYNKKNLGQRYVEIFVSNIKEVAQSKQYSSRRKHRRSRSRSRSR